MRPVLTFLIIALLCTGTFAYAATDERQEGFWNRVRAFFSSEPATVDGESRGVPNNLPPTQEETDEGQTDRGQDGSGGPATGGSGSTPDWACTPCRSVICEDSEGTFVCPNRLEVCQERYDGRCKELTCKEEDSCTARIHLCKTDEGSEKCEGPLAECNEKYGGTCTCGVPDDDTYCTWNGRTWEPGDSFPAGDGCNTCTCDENGNVGCTRRACKPCTQTAQTCWPDDGSGPIRCEGTLAECTARHDWCTCGATHQICDEDTDRCPAGYACSKSHLCVPATCAAYDQLNACEYARNNPERTTGTWPGPLGVSICVGITCTEAVPSSCVSTTDTGPYCLKEGGTYACCGWAGGAKPYCDWGGRGCVQCLEDSNCKAGLVCINGVCKDEDTQVCIFNDQKYLPGESFPDGCNTCTCLASGVISCTDRACPTDECKEDADCAVPCLSVSGENCPIYTCEDGTCVSADACEYNGREYAVGSSFPDTDGCNKCTCLSGGSVSCTEMACPTDRECSKDSDCPTITCIRAPCPTNVCRSGVCTSTQTSADTN